MSIVCAVATSDAVYFGADTHVRIGPTLYEMRKICVLSQPAADLTWVVGIAGDMRAANELPQVAAFPPSRTVDEFLRSIMGHLVCAGVVRPGEARPFELVVACVQKGAAPRLWVVSNSGAYTEIARGCMAAVGAGAQAALGAWWAYGAVSGDEREGGKWVALPVEAAIQLNAFCGGCVEVVRVAAGAEPEWLVR